MKYHNHWRIILSRYQSVLGSPRPATRSLTSSVCSTLTALTALSTWPATLVIKVRSVSLQYNQEVRYQIVSSLLSSLTSSQLC